MSSLCRCVLSALAVNLHDFLERIYAHAGIRTELHVALVSLLGPGWKQKPTKAFEAQEGTHSPQNSRASQRGRASVYLH